MASYFDYAGKALKPRFSTAAPNEIPSVAEVQPSADGTGLQVSGMFATWDPDSEGESFLPNAFDTAAPAALAAGIPVLYQHEKASVPMGYVTDMQVRRDGLWGSAILPKPSGGRALELYEAVKAGSIRAWSVAAFGLESTSRGRSRCSAIDFARSVSRRCRSTRTQDLTTWRPSSA